MNMSRRDLIKAVAGMSMVLVFGRDKPKSAAKPMSKKMGYISVKTHPELVSTTTIWMNGKLVQNCYAADDIRGIARCYTRLNGLYVLEISRGHNKVGETTRLDLKVTTIHGPVEIRTNA